MKGFDKGFWAFMLIAFVVYVILYDPDSPTPEDRFQANCINSGGSVVVHHRGRMHPDYSCIQQ